MPLTTSATGQLFASYQPDAIIEPLVMAEWQTKDKMAARPHNGNILRNCKLKIRTARLCDGHWRYANGYQRHHDPRYIAATGQNAFATSSIHHDNNDKRPLENLSLEYAITIIGTTEQLPMSKQHNVVEQILAIAQRYQIA